MRTRSFIVAVGILVCVTLGASSFMVSSAGATQGNITSTLASYGQAQPSQCSADYLQNDFRFGPAVLPTTGRVGQEVAGYDPFGGLGPAGLLSDFWNNGTNSWNYPPFNGFLVGSDGQPIESPAILPAGQPIDRYGSEYGQFLSPAGAPYTQRALPPSNLNNNPSTVPTCNYHLYQVVAPLSVLAGPAAPWFGQQGLGTQYYTSTANVMNLIAQGTLIRCDLGSRCPGYLLVGSDGGVFTFGGAAFNGSLGGQPGIAPVRGGVLTPDSLGYWLVAADGGIFSFGDANFYGSEGGRSLNQPIVGMAAGGGPG